MTVERTNPALVQAVATDIRAPYQRTASGYGGKLPTRYRIRYANRWRRVYAMCYGNAASAYVVVNGAPAFLDIATEYALQDGLPDASLGMFATNKESR